MSVSAALGEVRVAPPLPLRDAGPAAGLARGAAACRCRPHGARHRLAALLPDARLVIIPGTRALVPEDQPDLLADALLPFLAATSTARGA